MGTETQPLLERESALDALTALVERAASGNGTLATIVAPAGAGKTTLVREAHRIADAHGFDPFRARAGELEATLAFSVVRNLFERPLLAPSESERSELLQGAAAHAARVLSLEEPGVKGQDPAPSDTTFAALHGLYWLTANLAQRRPLLVSVDDAHWADAASLRFLAYLAQRVDELPVVLLVASRPPEPGSEADLIAALTSAPLARAISAAPLSVPAVAQLLRSELGSEPDGAFADAVHRATGGNPFLVTSLGATLRESELEPTDSAVPSLGDLNPREVTSAVTARLRRLPAPWTSLAQAVAVLGPAADLRRAAELAGLGEGEATDAADGLAAQQILCDGGPLEFAHPLVRAAVYDALPHGERARAHARAARLLDRDLASAELIAPHLTVADPAADPWVVERLRAAAGAAARLGAAEAAVSYLRRALSEPPAEQEHPHVLRELGSAEYKVGEPAAVEHLQEALRAMPTPQLQAEVARELTRGLLPSGRFVDAVGALEDAIGSLGVGERELVLELEAELATAGRLHPSTQPATAARLERLATTVDGSTPAERLVLASLGFQRALVGESAERAAAFAELALDGGLLGERGPDAPAFADVSATLIMAERFERAGRALDEALSDARAGGSLIGFAVVSAFRALLALHRGAVHEAEGEAQAALHGAAETGSEALRAMSQAFVIEALVERGQIDAARAVLSEHATAEIPDNLMLNFLLHARARARLAAGELEPGLADLRELGRREDALGWRNPARFPHRSEAALVLAQLGEGEEARSLAREELDLARTWGTPRATGVALRALGLVSEPAHGVDYLRESVAILEGSEARLERARGLVDLGAALRRAASRADAREPLRLGMDLAGRCGAAALVDRAAEELRATGARPRRSALTGVDSLTASELRVARMAAEGMTNREIAQALFVTMRTVEVHLTHTYQKLDISSRVQLTSVLAG